MELLGRAGSIGNIEFIRKQTFRENQRTEFT